MTQSAMGHQLGQKGTRVPDHTGRGDGPCSKHEGRGPEQEGHSAPWTSRGRTLVLSAAGSVRPQLPQDRVEDARAPLGPSPPLHKLHLSPSVKQI